MTTMTRLKIIDSGVIFRNPLPGHRVINAIYPFILPLDGELLCVLRNGQALYSPDGILELFRSLDGSTWERQGLVRSREDDTFHYNYLDAHLTLLRDRTLLMRLSRVCHNDPNNLLFNPETQGLLSFETCYLSSFDNGKTWSEPVVPELNNLFVPEHVPVSCGQIVELDDGSWFQAFETWKCYSDPGPFDLNTYGLISDDRGRTWRDRVSVANGSVCNLSYSHAQPIRLDDGRLFASVWAAESQLQEFHGLYAAVSLDDYGREWEDPRPLGIPGQTSCALDMGDNLLLIVYSHRDNTEQPGIKVVLSEDGGQNWFTDSPLLIWDAYGKEALGVARTDTYPSNHDAIAYGAPRIIKLDDRRAIASFWCTQAGDTHCRYSEIEIL